MRKVVKNIICLALLASYISIGIVGYITIQIAIGFGTDPFHFTQTSNIPFTHPKHVYSQQKHISSVVKQTITLIAITAPRFNHKIDKNYELLPIEKLLYYSEYFSIINSSRSPPLM